MKALTALALSSLLALVTGQDPIQQRLEDSPRHHEWIDVQSGERKLRCFVVYPEVKDKAPAVLVIHENKGLNDWARSVADQLAEAGYIAIAPDMISGMGPEQGNTDSFKSTDAATQAIYKLDAEGVGADLNAVADAVLKLPSCNGKLSVAGFCWGGTQTFEFATRRKGLTAACVFYGSAPKDEAALAKIDCTVYGFYGESDNRINAGIDATKELMKKLDKVYEPVIYAGAGHGFMRAGEAAEATKDTKHARDDAWKRWKEILGKSPVVAK
jgi:carboxymethylenebutenolidase